MGLNENQKKAVEYLDGPLLVLAGPGTGKTQLLSHKVAYILQNTDTNPENILCLTFTETGASNMRERLKSIIGKDALKVNIGTYHAFGSDIIAQYKSYAVDFDRKLESPIDEVTQYKIVKSIQDDLSGDDILRGDPIRDIISVIGESKSAGLSADDLQKIAEQNIEDSRVLSEVISPFLLEVVPRKFNESYERAYKPIYEILSKYSDVPPILGAVERSIAGMARDLKNAIIEAESTQKIKPLSTWKDKYFEKNAKGTYCLKDRVANRKLLSVANVMRKYQKYLLDNGLFDFDDMIEMAVRILTEDEGFKATLSERYQFIMLDEFQDTNPSQFAIVKKLTDYERPLIMAVGDDDQAIYEFQGALASNLTDFQAYYEAEVIPLVENYRSTQEILDFSREIIRQAPDRFADKELIAHKEDPKVSQIHRIEFASADAEYGYIAHEISELIKSGVSQNEIAIISYKSKYFEPLLKYLKEYPEIKIAYEKRDNLFEDAKIHEVLTMARFIIDLANNRPSSVSVLEVLTYSCLGLPAVEVIRMVEKAKHDKKSVFDVMSASENVKIASVAEWFAEMAVKSLTESLDVILGCFVEKMDANEMGEYERFRFYENLASLKGKLRRHYGEKSLKLADLVELIDDYEAAGMALTTTSPYRDSAEAVQILTAHKAKGLEFEYVFIVSADHTAWGKGKGNNNLLALPKNLMQIRHTGTTDGEKLRILYVALTRAKSHLVITNSLADFSGKSPERLEYFEEYGDGDVVISPFVPSGRVELMYQTGSYELREQNVKNWLMNYVAYEPDMRAIYKERVANWRMSASALTSFVDIVYAGPLEFFKSYILRAPREPETEALAFGTLVHEVFEAVTNKGISDDEAVELFLTNLDKRDLPTSIVQKIREKGPNDLLVSLREFRDVLRIGQAEVDFASDRLVVGGVPITGKVDHIILDEDTKEIEIYDYKTGGYHKEKWASHTTLYKYMLQLGFYKLLLNNSPRYAKYKVTKAHILFVVPDRDGEVYDKVYEFNRDDEKKLIELIKAVYQEVYSLSFIDDADLFRPPDAGLGIKDIKSFIELLLAKSVEK